MSMVHIYYYGTNLNIIETGVSSTNRPDTNCCRQLHKHTFREWMKKMCWHIVAQNSLDVIDVVRNVSGKMNGVNQRRPHRHGNFGKLWWPTSITDSEHTHRWIGWFWFEILLNAILPSPSIKGRDWIINHIRYINWTTSVQSDWFVLIHTIRRRIV